MTVTTDTLTNLLAYIYRIEIATTNRFSIDEGLLFYYSYSSSILLKLSMDVGS